MKNYYNKKDSGVEWIGEIPSHWEVKKLKYFSLITLGKMLTPEDGGGYHLKPYLRSVNIQTENVDISNVKEMWFTNKELEKFRLKNGDVLVNEGGDVGRTSIWNDEIEECYIQNSVNRVRVRDSYPRFVLYVSGQHHKTGYYDSQVDRVSIPHLTKERLEVVKFVIPPIPEQEKIVSFLDSKTSLIDKIIENKTQRIELLKEMRSSLISEVVTKGLNPDVPLKDSGVEWIGEIPSHWIVSKVKFFYALTSGFPFDSETLTNEPTQYPVIRIGNVTSGKIDIYYSGSVNDRLPVVDTGDYVVSLTGDFNIREWKQQPSLLNQRCGLVKVIGSHFPRYLYYVLPDQFTFLENTKYYTTLKNLSNGEFLNIQLLVPPIDEQQQIVSFLDEKTSLIDQEIVREEKSIEYLKEFRQSLIHEVVTGKMDVRGVVTS